MKDISIYFKPLKNDEVEYSNAQLGAKLIQVDDFQDGLDKNSVALLFVDEYRNSDIKSESTDFSIIQQKLKALNVGDWHTKIYVLGKINPGSSPSDTFMALKEVVAELVKNDVIPVVIGGSQDLTFAMYQAYEKLEQTVNLMTIDAEFDLGDPDKDIAYNAWLNKIIMHQPNYLFNYTNLGYQRYYVNSDEINLFDKLYFDHHSLGEFYSDNKMVEPLVRNADILSFDLNAIRSSDYKANSKDSPHGFYGEDACRIMRYAGLSDKLTSLGIFNHTSQPYFQKQDANLIAQMIWYFIEGVNNQKADYPKGSKANYTKYRVAVDEFKDEIVFYKSDKSGRWWMEVPYPNSEKLKFQRHLLIPCTYQIYQDALKSDLPNLWWKTYQKLL
jgi:arginase family enzyme